MALLDNDSSGRIAWPKDHVGMLCQVRISDSARIRPPWRLWLSNWDHGASCPIATFDQYSIAWLATRYSLPSPRSLCSLVTPPTRKSRPTFADIIIIITVEIMESMA